MSSSDAASSNFDLSVDAYDQIKGGINQLCNVESLMEEFMDTKKKEVIQSAVSQLDHLSILVEQLSRNPESFSTPNAPLLIKLHGGTQKMTKLVAQTTCGINKSAFAKYKVSSEIKKDIQSHKIQDSLDTDITAHNAHLGSTTNKAVDHPLQGYLRKQGAKDMKLWSIRWFAQNEDSLHYFVSENSTARNGAIPFSAIVDVNIPQIGMNSCDFQIVTLKRVYRLQTMSNSELDYWRHGLTHWRSIYPPDSKLMEEFTIQCKNAKTEARKKRGSSFPASFSPQLSPSRTSVRIHTPSSSKYLPQTLEDALLLIRSQQQQLMEQQQEIDQFKKQEELTGSEVITELRKENNRLRQELEVKDSLLNDLEESTSSLKKETLLHKKLSGVDHDQYSSRLLDEMKDMESNLSLVEEKLLRSHKSSKMWQEKVHQLENTLETTAQSLEQLRMETQGKDKYITKLTLEMKKMNRLDPRNLKASPSRIKEEFFRLRESSQAHQTRNVFLSSELQRVEQESKLKMEGKEIIILRLEQELEALSKQYQELRKQNYLLQGADSTYLAELEEVKESFFYSMAVSIKLNAAAQGKPCNMDIQSLYQQAQSLDWNLWNTWLTRRMSECTEDNK